jgi:hypothetical protein
MDARLNSFDVTLKIQLKKRYDDDVPQAHMLARLFNMRCDEKDAINEETMQAWLDGKTEPSGPELKVLQVWLGL